MFDAGTTRGAIVGAAALLMCSEHGQGRDQTQMADAAKAKPAPKPDFCMFLANHWSYTGIGWNSGLKSCTQSITGSLDMADYAPSVKTGINLDAPAYALITDVIIE
ncbi:MAG: hypothetical protein PHR35_22595 [Kiritimatiellae bacterium]|nr:hypothetical protein [Kiritimatiellia bacterium]